LGRTKNESRGNGAPGSRALHIKDKYSATNQNYRPRTTRPSAVVEKIKPSNRHQTGTAQICRPQHHNKRPPLSALLDTFWRCKKCRPRQGVPAKRPPSERTKK